MKATRFAKVLSGAAFFLVTGVFAADRTVSVSGTCLRQITPDRGTITLTSELKGADPKRLAAEVGQLYERVKDRVGRLRVEGIEFQTTEYLVEEIREWEKERMVSKGFRARMSLKVSTPDHARLGEVAELASREGVKEISRLQLYTSLQKQRAERNECLKEAAEQARLKAQKLAETLGGKLGEVASIQELSGPIDPGMPPQPFAESAMMRKSLAAPVIDAGKEDLTVSVAVTFNLK